MDKLIQCLKELENLKSVQRGANVDSRKESTAEHSWSCMLIADIVLPHIEEKLDRLKVLEILLYHDIVEVYAGDAKFNNPKQMKLKEELEAKGMKKIIALLPDPERYKKLMEEYESRNSRESKFAKAIDCIDTCIRSLNDARKCKEDGFTKELIRAKYKPHVKEFHFIDKLFEELMALLISQGKI